MQLEKIRLRDDFKKLRSNLSAEEVIKKSAQINQNFIKNLLPNFLLKKSEKNFSLYISSDNEVYTNNISQHFIKNNISFSYPKIIAKNQPLEFILAAENQTFINNKFYPKVVEPLDGKIVLPDFLILPLLAFDGNLTRLGMGGGFFDRTISNLKKQKSQIVTIGLGYEFQRSHKLLPVENTDCRLDFIVTEKTIFSAN